MLIFWPFSYLSKVINMIDSSSYHNISLLLLATRKNRFLFFETINKYDGN